MQLSARGIVVAGMGALALALVLLASPASADTKSDNERQDEATGGGAGPTNIYAYAVTTEGVRITENNGSPGGSHRRVICYWFSLFGITPDRFQDHTEIFWTRNPVEGTRYLLQCGHADDKKEDHDFFFDNYIVNEARVFNRADLPDVTDINDVIRRVRDERADLFFEPTTGISPEGVDVPVGVELWVWVPEDELVDIGPVTAEAGPLWSQTGASFSHVEWVVYDGADEVDRFECEDMAPYDPDLSYEQQRDVPHCAIVFDDEPQNGDTFTIEPELHYEIWLEWGQVPATPAGTAPVVDIADFVPAVGGTTDVPVVEIQAVIRFG